MPSYTEEDVTIALNALVNSEYKSIRKAAIAFQIPSSTLYDRRKKSKSRTESHVSQQLLTPIEETTLENWILHEHKYPPSAIYNVDETGFQIGSSRKSVILLNQLNQRREKKQLGRQEWITCLVCQRLGGDPASMSDFQRTKSKFRMDS